MPVGTITFPTTIDSDQTLSGAANNVTVLLDQAVNSTQTSIAVADTTFFPAAGFATIVDNLTTPTKIEIISYTQISGNTLQSVIRGAQGTTPQSFSTGYVEIRPTAGHHLALVDAVIAIENRLGTGSTLSLTKGGTGRAFTTMPGTDRIFFWDASANSMQLLELGTNLSITGTVLNATGGAGPAADVIIGLGMPNIFSVTPASITNNGVFDVQFVSQTANTVLAGPTTGAAAVPAFRALVAGDIPALSYVTSVGLSLPSIFTVSNSPVTSSGTLTATLATQAENLVLVGPINAPAATPTFRLLEDEDIPNVLTIHKNRHLTTNGFVKTTNGDGTYAVDTGTYLTGNQTVTLSGDVTGSGATSITTTIANGAVTYAKIQNISATSRVLGRKTAGAGSTEELTFSEVLDFVGSAAQGDILYRDSTGWARLAAGTSGQYLQTQGAAANPQWATVVAGGTPGGSSGQVQFNSAGSFGGATGFTYQSGASPNVTITAQSASHIPLTISSAATPTAKLLSIQNNGTERIAITSGFIQEFYSVGVSASILSAYEGTTSSSQIRVSLTRGILGFYETNAIFDNTANLNTIVRSGSSKLTVANGQTAELYYGTGSSAIVYNALIMRVNQGGTPTAGYGCGLAFGIKTNTADRTAATLAAAWSTVTDGSRSAYFTTSLEDNAITREYVRVAGNGANTATMETATCTSGATTVTALLEQNVTLSTAGNTTDTTIQIPANSFILAVSVRVTTTIAGVDSTSLQVGDATTAERFGSIGTLTANTTGVGLNQLQGSVSTNAAGPIVTSATAVRLTLTGGSDNIPSAGAVRVTIHYIQLTAATS